MRIRLFTVFCAGFFILVPWLTGNESLGKGPRKEFPQRCVRHTIPENLVPKGFRFAGEIVPVFREDIRERISFQINFLMLDARSVLTDWLKRLPRYAWIFREVFSKQNVPEEFIFFAPVVSGLDPRRSPPDDGVGCWNLKGLCSKKKEGVSLTKSRWHDDRQDLELSTQCFAARIKELRSSLGSWIKAAAAYVSSESEIEASLERWKVSSIWDYPMDDQTEELVCRWIAFAIIAGRHKEFGLEYKPCEPLSYDEVSGLKLAKDLPVSEVSQALGVSSLYIMDLNPKIKVAAGKLPAKHGKKTITHKLATPKGRGWKLVKHLKRNGYLKKKK
jgi:membrane-bound lytic murein transglycosylase D